MAKKNIPESVIRDSLAKNLHLIEPGLELIKVEYKLKNPLGSKGFIDILAKDKLGTRVVIEVKRCDAAARQAIHEIFKYFGLYQAQNQVPDHGMRCIVVSTTWRELRVPFDQFVKRSTLKIDGYQIDVDDKGDVISSEKIKPLRDAASFKVFRSHDVYLFETKEKRDAAIPVIAKAFKDCGGESGLLIPMDYEGGGVHVIYSFAVYLVVGRISTTVVEEMKALCLEENSDFDPDSGEGQEAFEGEFSVKMQETTLELADCFEPGSHEKFGAESELGWKEKSIHRLGDVPDSSAATDEEILVMVAGYEGENAVLYHRVASPSQPLLWEQVPVEFEFCLRGNNRWSRAATWFLDWIEANVPNAIVSICIYNLQDLIITIYGVLRGRLDFLPYIEIVAKDEATGHLYMVKGDMRWDGVTRPDSIRNVFTPGIGGLDSVRIHSHMKDSWRIDEDLMTRHGLYYATYYAEYRGDGLKFEEFQLVEKNGRLVRGDVTTNSLPLPEFFEENIPYLHEFGRDMAMHFSW